MPLVAVAVLFVAGLPSLEASPKAMDIFNNRRVIINFIVHNLISIQILNRFCCNVILVLYLFIYLPNSPSYPLLSPGTCILKTAIGSGGAWASSVPSPSPYVCGYIPSRALVGFFLDVCVRLDITGSVRK